MAEGFHSFISKLHFSISKGLPHAEPLAILRTTEHDLVQNVLQMIQGFSCSLFYWDEVAPSFRLKDGIYASHLSQTSLSGMLDQFVHSGTCLKKVELFVKKVEASHQSAPTLKAFANSVFSWLKRLRGVALAVEVKLAGSDNETTITLLELTNSLSSVCSAAKHLLQVVYGSIPSSFFESETSSSAGEMAVHILNHLFMKLNEICLVQGGEEEPYHMLLAIFTGSFLPYLEGLDSWLYDGILDDPYAEIFFYANRAITIDQPAFWERSYLLRPEGRKTRSCVSLLQNDGESTGQVRRGAGDQEPNPLLTTTRQRDQNDADTIACPVFLKDIAKSIVSAGKSLQLVQHDLDVHLQSSDKSNDEHLPSTVNHMNQSRVMGVLTLPEVFLVSLAGLIGDGSHIYNFFRMPIGEISQLPEAFVDEVKLVREIDENVKIPESNEKNWFNFLNDVITARRHAVPECTFTVTNSVELRDMQVPKDSLSYFCPENPAITACRDFLRKRRSTWNELNISRNFYLPSLNDANLREAIFGENYMETSMSMDPLNKECTCILGGTNYSFGFQFDELERLRLEEDMNTLETLYPFPTTLPYLEEDVRVSELLPFQRNSTLASRILEWIQSIKLKTTPHPALIFQECLAFYIKKQVDHIGKHILLKLTSDWKLMDELGVLRSVYLLGSGDLLQQFLIVIFDKLDKGDSWDDDFELNTVLQESIRNSADGTLLTSPDSLVVSIPRQSTSDDEAIPNANVITPRKVRNQIIGIDALDLLKFTYKVSWPLDLIANVEALKKYNQVMCFLLKVKRAKYVLDKSRKWMWKGRGRMMPNYKHHLLVQQKLLHFVDAFHQYVMDRVFHSSWVELCSGMASAGSLDEVIEVHEAYLQSIQKQCFVAPDKLWALLASRVKTILGLALDFYCVHQTLTSGGAAAGIKVRCEMEVDRIEKQFDDCIAFLLRILSFKLNVGHFPHLADLVTRINYNYYYMSSSGNLLTVPSFEATAAKLAKV